MTDVLLDDVPVRAPRRRDTVDAMPISGSDIPLWETEYAVTDPKTKRTKIRRSTILAPSRQDVVIEYDKIGATAISVKPASVFSRVWNVLRPPNAKALIDFFRAYHSLYTMVPNDEIVAIAAEECSNPRLKATLEEMTIEVIDGVTISAACARRPREFSPTLVALLRAGERGARNSEVLKQLTDMLADRASFRNELISTASYPVFILACLLLFIIVLGSFVGPKLQSATDTVNGGLGTQPSGMIAFVSAFAAFLTSPIAIVGGIVAAFGIFVALLVYGQTPRGRSRIAALSLRVPFVGRILAKMAEAQFARTYGTLASALLPTEAFRLSIPAAGHPTFIEALTDVYPQVVDGHKVSTLLKATKRFSRRFTSVLFIGEKSNSIDKQMLTYADETKREVVTLLQALGKPLQGLFYVVAGAVTLIVVLPILGNLLNYFHAILPAPGPTVP